MSKQIKSTLGPQNSFPYFLLLFLLFFGYIEEHKQKLLKFSRVGNSLQVCNSSSGGQESANWLASLKICLQLCLSFFKQTFAILDHSFVRMVHHILFFLDEVHRPLFGSFFRFQRSLILTTPKSSFYKCY